MRYTKLGIGGVQASVLGFGCAAVMGRSGRSQSLHALHAAYDGGITFFDTARSYGYGESESVVGEFLRGRRDRVILSTKFGIVPKRQPSWKRALMPALRTLLEVAPSARKLVRNRVNAQLKGNQLTVKVLRESVEESLRQLRTDYIDILFMHAAPGSALEQFDVLDELENLIIAGKIRMAGISAEPEVILSALEAKIPVLRAIQFPVNLFDLRMMRIVSAAESKGLVFVANHPFGGVDRVNESNVRLRALAELPSIPPELRSKLNGPDDGVLSEVVLNLILIGTGIQIALPSMMNESHLKANLKAISNCRFTAEELNWIRCHFTGETNFLELHPAHEVNVQASYR
jgi:aryl-alcohol dehydrogenase-like predicted oxidoreductase